jgi:hypothetical protein
VPGELFAKVIETWPEDTSRVVVSFTSLSEAARTFLDTVREMHILASTLSTGRAP